MMRTATFLLLVGLAAAGCGVGEPRMTPVPVALRGRVGSHGMVAFGTPAEAFVSHIPMFGPPHDVQAVVAGSFRTLDGSPLPATLDDRLFTFVPDRMSLDAFRDGSLTELQGQIFRGNFEAGGEPLPARVRFVASRVVHQHVLNAPARRAGDPSELGYLFVGRRDRAFAVHQITWSPSFDEVVKVDLGGDAPSDAELAAGVEATVAGAADDPGRRLGLAEVAQTMRAGHRTFTATPHPALSCLVGPEFSAPCKP
jgi:hypothetical protein